MIQPSFKDSRDTSIMLQIRTIFSELILQAGKCQSTCNAPDLPHGRSADAPCVQAGCPTRNIPAVKELCPICAALYRIRGLTTTKVPG